MIERSKKSIERKNINLGQEFHFARIGLGIGAAALFLSTAYMNVSGWIAQAEEPSGAIANATLAISFELTALCGLSWAGFQYAKGRKSAAGIAAAIAIVAIIFNTLAAQNFLHAQAQDLSNTIEFSGQTVAVNQSEISVLEDEVESIVRQNRGKIPRPVDAIEARYADLNPERHKGKIARLNAEIALRREYDRLQAEIRDLRRDASEAAVTANDTGRTVIPASVLGPFVWALEIVKGTIFFALGTATGKKPQTKQDRKKWAIISSKTDDDERAAAKSSEVRKKPHKSSFYRSAIYKNTVD